MTGKNFPRQRQRAHVDFFGLGGAGRRVLQPAVLTERSDELAAGRVDIVMIDVREIGDRPRLKLCRKSAVAILEKRPIEE